jgi:hypothetical protein
VLFQIESRRIQVAYNCLLDGQREANTFDVHGRSKKAVQPRIAIRGLCLHGFNTSNLSIGDDCATIDMNHAPGQENQLWWCSIYKEIREVNARTPRFQIEKVTWLQIEKVIWLQVEKLNNLVLNKYVWKTGSA